LDRIASAATRMFSSTVSDPNASSRWNVRAIPCRARRCVGVCVMSFPLRNTRPAVGFCKPVMTLNSVVFPAPFGPISAVTCPPSAEIVA
jgi:hypothetical protein